MDCEFTRSCEESIRRAPLASMGIAALGALVVSKLPVGAIIGALLRLAFALFRPALLVFGILKIAELCRESCARSCEIGRSRPAESRIPEAIS
ncbi:MAG: hypothetical protein ACREKL_12115 [Chthoniobacterales bacterium]